MNNYKDTDKDIHTRIKKFVIDCFTGVVKQIPKKAENIPIIKQISASLTSIGANDSEADSCESNKDFIAKYTIVKKETNETIYWLEIISATEIISPKLVGGYVDEAKEILLIISKILINSKKHLK